MENRPFSWAAMAGLGKYRKGGYGRIGVSRVKDLESRNDDGRNHLKITSSVKPFI